MFSHRLRADPLISIIVLEGERILRILAFEGNGGRDVRKIRLGHSSSFNYS